MPYISQIMPGVILDYQGAKMWDGKNLRCVFTGAKSTLPTDRNHIRFFDPSSSKNASIKKSLLVLHAEAVYAMLYKNRKDIFRKPTQGLLFTNKGHRSSCIHVYIGETEAKVYEYDIIGIKYRAYISEKVCSLDIYKVDNNTEKEILYGHCRGLNELYEDLN